MDTPSRPPLPSPDELINLPPDGGPSFNRLVFSQSPYLLQHARNPVDWYPWGEEAFAEARKQDKPVFLSVGYSTCHWCHVMEHESFEDQEVADLLNKHFICVKVDREERPDIDKIYMDVTQALTGRGGWPMTVVLTPDRKPFFAGTYFPKVGRFQQPGMMDLVPQLSEAWKTKREDVLQSADQITAHLRSMNVSSGGKDLDPSVLDSAYAQLRSRFDPERGGFGDAPKFPTPHNLTFLVRHGLRSGDSNALEMVVHTLTEMRKGGIFDQVGLGFHRYSTDAQWLLPHFEKMLYDQALIAMACLDAFQAGGDPLMARTAREVFEYVLRDMTSPEGGFYSAEDADSEGEEGTFYLWTTQEVLEVLEPDDARTFIETYALKPTGNFTHEVGGHDSVDNIPHLLAPPANDQNLEAIRQSLFEVREKRVHPFKDDKVLTDWNGLMIAALARGAQVLEEPRYAAAAVKAADFVLTSLRNEDGRLLKRYRHGQAGQPAHLEDYSFMVWGLLNLYETTFDATYLREAIRLNQVMIDHFWDPKDGGFFMTADDSEALLVRGKELYDGAIPSGNSVGLLNLARLSRLTGTTAYADRARQLASAFSAMVRQSPSAFTQFLSGLDFLFGPTNEIVVTGDRDECQAMLDALHTTYLPNAVVVFRPVGEDVSELIPYSEAMTPLDGKPTAYVCREFACQQPTTDIDEMLAYLRED